MHKTQHESNNSSQQSRVESSQQLLPPLKENERAYTAHIGQLLHISKRWWMDKEGVKCLFACCQLLFGSVRKWDGWGWSEAVGPLTAVTGNAAIVYSCCCCYCYAMSRCNNKRERSIGGGYWTMDVSKRITYSRTTQQQLDEIDNQKWN